MARRKKKLNVPLIVTLLVIALLIAAASGVFVYKKYLDHETAEVYIERGDRLMESVREGGLSEADRSHALQEARRCYAEAVKWYGPEDRPDLYPELHFKLCQVTHELGNLPMLARVDRTRYRQDSFSYLNQVLVRDPEHEEALAFVVDMYWPRIRQAVSNIDRNRRLNTGDGGPAVQESDIAGIELFVEQCTNLIEAGGDNSEAYFRRGMVYRMLLDQDFENGERALADFDAALALEPDNIEYWVDGKLALLEQLDRMPEAEAACREAIAINENAPLLYLRLYELRVLQEAQEDLTPLLEEAVARAPHEGLTYIYLGRHLLYTGELDRSAEVFREGIINAPNALELYEQLSEVQTYLRQFTEAVATLEAGNAQIDSQIAALIEESEDVATDMDIRNAEGHRLRMTQNVCNAILNELVHYGGFTYEERRRINELSYAAAEIGAEDVATRLSTIATDEVITDEDRAAITAFIAEGLLSEEDLNYLQRVVDTKLTPEEKDARLARLAEHQAFIESLRGSPAFREAQYEGLLGRMAWYEGDMDLAKEHLERANALSTEFDPVLKNLLMDIYRTENDRTAEEMIVDEFLAHRLYRRHPLYLYRKAELLMRYRDYDGAARMLEDLTTAYPDFEPGQQLMLQLAAATGNIRAVNLDPDAEVPPVLLTGLLNQTEQMWNSGDRAGALREAEALFQRLPHNVRVGGQLARMYVRMNRMEEATAIMQDLAARYPENEQLAFEAALIAESDPDVRRQMQEDYIRDTVEDDFERAIMSANMAIFDTDMESAMEHLQTAATIDPRRNNCLARLFSLALQEENWDYAEWALALAQEVDIDGVGGRTYLAFLATKRAEIASRELSNEAQDQANAYYAEAAGYLEEAIEINPQDLDLRARLGHLYLEQRLFDEARLTFEMIIRRDRGYAPAHIGLLYVALGSNDRNLWNDAVQSAYNLAPNDPFVRNQWLSYMEEIGQGDEQAIEQLIAEREAVFTSNQRDLENAYRLGRLYERIGMLEEAEYMFRHVYDESPNRTFGAGILMSYYDRVNETSQIHQIVAERLADAASDAERASIYILQGQILGKRELAMGVNAFNAAIALQPTHTAGYEAKAALLARHRRWAEAAETMRECLAMLDEQPSNEMVEAQRLVVTKFIARYLIEAGDLAGASEIIDAIRLANPDDVEGMVLLGVLQAKDGDVEAALDTLTQAIELSPNYVTAWAERAKIRLGRGEFHLASEDLRRAQALARTSQNIAFELALSHQQIGETQAAKDGYLRILEEDPSFEPAVRGLLTLYFNEQDWTRFQGLVEDAQRRFQTPYYFLVEADMWRARNVTDRRLRALAAALEAQGGRNDREVVRRNLMTLIEFGRDEQARELCMLYVDKVEFEPWIRAVLGRLDMLIGNTESADENFAFAVQNADFDTLSLVAAQIVEAYGLTDGPNRMLQWAQGRSAPEGREGDWQIYAIIAVVDSEAGEYQRALELLNIALDYAVEDQEKSSVLHLMGETCYAQGDYPASAEAYERALRFNATAATLNNLAYVYVDCLDDPESALPHAQAAAELQPMSPQVLDTLGWTLTKLRRYDQAVRYFNKSLNLVPLPVTRYHLAYALERMGRVTAARQQAQAALVMLERRSDEALAQQIRELLDRLDD